MIRNCSENDLVRLAEILVFNNRINYYPIFKDIAYSFDEYNVTSVMKQLRDDSDFISHTYVYEDEVVKGFIYVNHQEIKKLYVDSFFQNEGIGRKLISVAIEKEQASFLWALEKNEKAIRFYNRHGFIWNGKKELEEGTDEYLVCLERENKS